MKYDAQINELKGKLSSANRILIVVPSEINTDKLASALALYLSLQQSGRQVSIVSNGTLKVSDSNLYGVGDIKDTLPQSDDGNLTISLEGVVNNEGKVASLEKLDWYPSGNNLNLVFHVIPGQQFDPTNIQVSREGMDFEMIFVVGAANLSEVGNLYIQNMDQFTKAIKVNIDANPANNPFGEINIVDSSASCISEMIIQIISGLGLPIDAEIAGNVIAGIYSSTNALTLNTNPDTFLSIGVAMQAGGKLPQKEEPVTTPQPTPVSPTFDANVFMQSSQPQIQSIFNIPQPPRPQSQPENTQEETTVASEQVITEEDKNTQNQTSQTREEKPVGEYAVSSSMENEKPTPDWLTPKIYKGGSMG